MTTAVKLPTRERLLASTLELLARGGYSAASVAAITSGAGVAAGTLYRHFGSKEELFVELFREMCGREVDAMHEAAKSGDSPIGRLEAAIETFARRALVQPRVSWALLAEPVDALVDAERLEYRRRYRDLVAELLTEAVASGEIPECNAEVLAAAIVGGVGEALVGPLAAGRADTGALVKQLRDFTRRAAGT
ncbi:MAG: TetR/AcrR family transcriptional regulator [Solirubrobacterales bacterium]